MMFIDAGENLSYKKICKTLNRDEDLPLFPIDSGLFIAGKWRVQVARELDKLRLEARKKDVSKSWWKKAAEEAELEVSDMDNSDEDDDLEDKSGTAAAKAKASKVRIAAKQTELDALLSTPLTDQRFSGKYPTKSGKLEMPAQFAG